MVFSFEFLQNFQEHFFSYNTSGGYFRRQRKHPHYMLFLPEVYIDLAYDGVVAKIVLNYSRCI